MSTFVKFHRNLPEHWWYKDMSLRLVMMHLLLTVNHADVQMPEVLVRRGATVTSRAKLSDEIGLSQKVIRRCLAQLKMVGEVSMSRANKGPKSGTIITICNYDSYVGGTQKKDNDFSIKGQERANKRANKGPIKKESNSSNNQYVSNMDDNKKGQERANKRATNNNNIGVRNILSKDKNITHSVVGAPAREGGELQFSKEQEIENLKKRFFGVESLGSFEQLCMSLHCSTEEFKKIASEIFAEWLLTDEPVKESYNAAARHLIAVARIKLAEKRKADAARPVRSKEQWQADMERHLKDKYFKN